MNGSPNTEGQRKSCSQLVKKFGRTGTDKSELLRFQFGDLPLFIIAHLQILKNAAPPTRSTPYGATAGQASYDILGGKATRLLVKNNHAEEKLSCPESNSVVCF